MTDRRAHAVLFGFDFQVKAAMVLMLENIKEMTSLRLEGNYEDIEITLTNNQKIFAQAKAVVKSSYDFANVRKNLKKALTSLSEGACEGDVRQLIFITNSPNPFNDEKSRSIFLGSAHRCFNDLPPTAQEIIENYLRDIEHPLDTQKLMIQVFPFETDNEAERYKYVMQVINDFIGELNANTSPGLGKRLFQVWCHDIFVNGTKENAAIKLDKRSIIWPIMVLETDIARCDADFVEQFDAGVYDEIVELYQKTIDSCCERIDFFSKIIYDFSCYQSNKKAMEKCSDFVENNWKNYRDSFSAEGIDDETQEALTKIVLYNIVRRRIVIDKIKQGVNL